VRTERACFVEQLVVEALYFIADSLVRWCLDLGWQNAISAPRGAYCIAITWINLVAGVGFEPTTFRL
jgi:hypothetical protein